MKLFSVWQLKDIACTTAIVFGLYLFTYFLVWAFITPVQQAVIPDITKFASLLFLPHGIRIFATSLLGVRAIPGMVLAELAGNVFFWGLTDPHLLIAVSVISGSITWLVFEGLRRLRIHAYYLQVTGEPPAFHTLMLAGILASAANAFLLTSLLESDLSVGHVTSVLAAYLTGDVTGLLAVMLAARHMAALLALGRE